MPPVAPDRRGDIVKLLQALRNKAQQQGSDANFTFQKDLTKVERCNKRIRNMTDVGKLSLSTKGSRKVDNVLFKGVEPMPDDPGGEFVDGYAPKPNTGAWAILVALERMTARSLHGTFHKDEICREAGPLCSVKMIEPRGAKGGWDGNTTLVEHELIHRENLRFNGEATGKERKGGGHDILCVPLCVQVARLR